MACQHFVVLTRKEIKFACTEIYGFILSSFSNLRSLFVIYEAKAQIFYNHLFLSCLLNYGQALKAVQPDSWKIRKALLWCVQSSYVATPLAVPLDPLKETAAAAIAIILIILNKEVKEMNQMRKNKTWNNPSKKKETRSDTQVPFL